MNEQEQTDALPEFTTTFNNTVLKATEQSLYRQALGPAFITTRVIEEERDFYSEKEVLYRYFDHAERGQRQIDYIKQNIKTEFKNALEWQDYVLDITDRLALISISFRAIKDFKQKFNEDETTCLNGDIRDMDFDKILHEIANGVAHIRNRGGENVNLLRNINSETASSGIAPNGKTAHSIYSNYVTENITKLLFENFINPESNYFKETLSDIKLKDPELLSFQPYLVEKPE
jgi:hypothetical protein|tara:strand:- start:232 stop:927 length:696 start_codon:yes stop_codon:yes gene_type:complete